MTQILLLLKITVFFKCNRICLSYRWQTVDSETAFNMLSFSFYRIFPSFIKGHGFGLICKEVSKIESKKILRKNGKPRRVISGLKLDFVERNFHHLRVLRWQRFFLQKPCNIYPIILNFKNEIIKAKKSVKFSQS